MIQRILDLLLKFAQQAWNKTIVQMFTFIDYVSMALRQNSIHKFISNSCVVACIIVCMWMVDDTGFVGAPEKSSFTLTCGSLMLILT